MKKLLLLIAFISIVCFTNAQTAYITSGNYVFVVNVATNTVTTSIAVGSYPRGVSVSSDGRKVYVANEGNNSVSVINTSTNTVTATIPVGSVPLGVSVSPNGSKVYVTNYGLNTVSVIDTTTNTVTATITVGTSPEGISVSPDGSKVYVANNNSASVSVINTSTNTVTSTITVGTQPYGISVSPDGSKVYVTNSADGTVSVISSSTNTVTNTIAVGSNPVGVVVSHDGNNVYVANSNSASVSVINTSTNNITSTITVGNGPMGVSVSPDGSNIYVANNSDGTVNVIKSTTNTVTDTITVGSSPYGLGNFISTYSCTAPSFSVQPSSSTQSICQNGTATALSVTASPATAYQWYSNTTASNNGGTEISGETNNSFTPYTYSAGTLYYYCIASNSYCTKTSNVSGAIAVLAPNASITPQNATICLGNSETLTASGGGTYAWSNGLGNSNTVVVTPTTYTNYNVTVTSFNGCSTQVMASINVSNPSVSISATTNPICKGDTTTLSAGYMTGSTYTWSNGLGTANSVEVSPSTTTTYTVTISSFGCTASSDITVTVNQKPTPIITGNTTICQGNSTTLDAGTGYSTYLWSTNETTETISPATTDTYTVTVTNSFGCSGTASVTFTENQNPTPSITGNTTICYGGSTKLDAGTGYSSYLWSTSATTENITVSTAGTYTVTVTNSSGCTGSTSVTTYVTQAPYISGSTSICPGGYEMLMAGTSMYYSWSTGATTQGIQVSAAGTYTVTVTLSGCSSSTSINVSVDSLKPVITGTTAICSGTAATLDAGSGYSTYSWSTGATTETISATTTGSYTVTVSKSSGCSGKSSITVNSSTSPTVSITGPSSVCMGDSAKLDAGTGYTSYLWNTGAKTEYIYVSSANTYSVTVTNSSGCVGTASLWVNVNSKPTPHIQGDSIICSGNSANLMVSTAITYLWSTGATTQSISPSTAGLYSVTVSLNGCTGSTKTTVTVNQNPTPSITGNTTVCQGNSTTLDAGAGYSAYHWYTGATTETLVPTGPGTCSVTVTNSSGCTGTASVTYSVNQNPTPSITGNTTICYGGSTKLDAGTGYSSYLWSTSATTENITVSTAGTYTVTVTNSSGCTGSTSVTTYVTQAPYISGSTSICPGGYEMLMAGTSMYYSWSTGATTQGIQVSAAGTYTVTVTLSGCSSSTSINVSVDSLKPVITGTTAICSGTAATLDAGSGYSTYSWSTGATTETISATTTGSYTVTVSKSSGCSGKSSITVNSSTSPTVSITGPSSVCMGDSAKLDAGTGYTSYLWNTGAKTEYIYVSSANTYSVTVTNSSGCVGTASLWVNVNSKPTPHIQGDSIICSGNSANLMVSTAITYLWSTGATTQSISPSTAGLYSVTVSLNGCTGSTKTTVTVNQNPTPSITGNTTVCQGNSTTLDAGAGYSAYHWYTGATTETLVPTGPGTCSVTVTNSSGCTGTASVTYSVNQNPTPSITGATTICSGNNTTLDAGTGYSAYSWSNSAITEKITVSTAGTYTVTVTNSSGCTGSTSVTVIVNQNPTPSINGTTSICSGSSATLIVSTAITYLWSTGATTQSISPSTAGTYSVTVTLNGCTGSTNTTVTVNQKPTPNITGNTTICQGGSTTLDAGTGYSSYLWNTGATTETLMPTGQGTCTVTVTDANNCTNTASVTITQAAATTVSFSSQTNVSCNGGSNGSATASASGGTSPYAYSWNTSPVQTTATATGLAAGVYTVTVTNANACTNTNSVTITQPSALSASISSQTNVSCNGSGNGSVTITASGGTTPYSYIWSNSAITATISNLPAGTFTVTVTDHNGCTATAITTITQPSALSASIGSQTNVSCNGSTNGSVTANISGGVSPYSYLWSNSSNQVIASNLSAGAYTVTVTDHNGCTATAVATITQPSALSTSVSSQTNVNCNGGSNGSVTITASGGTIAYTYLWSNSATTATISNLPSGTFTVTVTDHNACTKTNSVTITQPIALSASIGSQTNVSCNGLTNGSATVTAGGGTPAYTYLWNTSPVQTTATATGLSANTYTVTVTDANSCTKTASVTITQPSVLSVTVTSLASSICLGSNTTLSATCGTGANYSWSPSTGLNTTTASSVTASPVSTTIYTVTASANGCSASNSITIAVNPTPAGTIASTIATCGNSNGTITVTPTMGTSPYTYSWSTVPAQTTATATSLNSGAYSVTITDHNGCSGTVAGTVQSNSSVSLSTSETPENCDKSNGTATVTATGGSGNYTYTWSNAQTTATATGLAAGIYSVTVSDGVCPQVASVTVTANQSPTPGITGNTTICYGSSTTLDAGTGYTAYSWSTGATTETISATTAATYIVTVTNSFGCTGSASVTTYVTPAPYISGSTTICSGSNEMLMAITSNSYIWSTGPTTQGIQVSTAGTYTVTVSLGGCTESASIAVAVTTLSPVITGTTSVCSGSTAILDAGTGYSSYLWSTGATTETMAPTGPSTYTVTVSNSSGCTGTASVVFVIKSSPSSQFTSSVTTNTANYTSTSGTGNIYFWDFGDGTISNLPNPSHTYNTAGYFTSCLTVTDTVTGNGCQNSYCNNILIGSPSTACLAKFGYSQVGNTVTFADSSLGNSTHWYWQFGDATSSTLKNPVHTYNYNGIYNISLTISNSTTNCSDIYTMQININSINDCVADFSYYASPTCNVATFNDHSTGNITNYLWDFGDGNTSTFSNAAHTYLQTGYYNVCHTAYNPTTSCYDMICKGVTVGNNNTSCKANFVFTIDSLTRTVKFSDCSYGSPNEWTWNFGDNTTSSLQNPSHVYSKDSMYMVQLNIKNDINNCSDFIAILVNVNFKQNLNCTFGYNANSSRGRSNSYPVDFVAAVFGNPSKYVWSFGDGGKDSSTTTPTHIYNTTGTFNVCLFVDDPTINESDTYCNQVEVSSVINNVNGYSQSNLINIYPDPATDNITVKNINFNKGQTISIYDIQGQLLIRQPMLQAKTNINVSALPSGVYFVKVVSENWTIAGKFMKEN